MNERQQKYVYVIGAGFSAGLGYPLTGDLLSRFWERIDDCSFRDKLKRVIEFHNPGFNCEEFVSFPNVEELLSQMLSMTNYLIPAGNTRATFQRTIWQIFSVFFF